MPVMISTKIREETETSIPSPHSDEQLVRDCIDGKHEAWSCLIDKYKNLIFSVPIKYGFSRDEAADIFQEVCLGLLSELKTLREPRALPKWLVTVTAHKCFHRKRLARRLVSMDSEVLELPGTEMPPEALTIIAEAEREQGLREAMSDLPVRCRRLIEMLFFEQPSRAYRDVAEALGIAVGSIGFIRQRCLEKMRKKVEDLGMR
jgi:RNA polymerase sigma factor (sigma-70 family)